jgi:glycosyl hydrolase family 18 (putative chitinase)
MRQRTSRVGAAVTALVATAAAMLTGAGGATAATPIPAHVYAPYFETWTSDGITATADASGTKYFTLAFLETTGKRSCTLAWNGSKTQTVADGRYLTDIASLRAAGGDVIPSLGGWSADQGGTEIGDSCADVNAIAAAYEQLVTTYDVTRIDMDIEGRSLSKPGGIDRRNKAIAKLQAWAKQQGRTVQVQYTLPTDANGLGSDSLAVLQNAVANHVRIDLVNPMVFDYYDGVTTDMGAAAINASKGLHAQLKTLFPSRTNARIWSMQGATMMNGVDDYPKGTEVTDLAAAQKLLAFAQSKGMSELSIWAIQRDNTTSGIAQDPYAFSHLLSGFTGP